MTRGKVGKWINNNLVMLVGIPLIIGVHYGWYKLQARDETEKKELPIMGVFNAMTNRRNERFPLSESSSRATQEKVL